MTENPLHPGFQPNVIAVVGNPRRDSRTLRLASGVADGLAAQVGSAPALTIDLVDLELDPVLGQLVLDLLLSRGERALFDPGEEVLVDRTYRTVGRERLVEYSGLDRIARARGLAARGHGGKGSGTPQ